ncbi:MAG: sulfate adenylyltransferase [Candidatus Hydrothermales bacterium]
MELVQRLIPKGKEIPIEKDLKKIEVDEDTLFDLEKIAIGSFTPLEGFMTKDELQSVCEKGRLLNNHPFTIPVLLQIDRETFKQIPHSGELLISFKGEIFGMVEVEEVYELDLNYVSKKVFGTESTEHPGVLHLKSKGDYAIGGKVWLFKRPKHPFSEYELTPEETRKIFRENNFKTVCAFQTRNAPHIAHEYLQRIALEITDCLFIHPILGKKKEGDYSNDIILRSYRVLIDNYFPRERVVLSGLTTPMRYAGPKEAVFHAVVRKNYGATHFIVGRDHAGVGNFYDPYAAHRIFDEYPDIGIEIIKVKSVFLCKKCDGVVSENTCPHSESFREYISMTKIRDALRSGSQGVKKILRPEVYEILRESFKNE